VTVFPEMVVYRRERRVIGIGDVLEQMNAS
jgi:hypothetical protein